MADDSFSALKEAQYWRAEAERAWAKRTEAAKERDAAIAAKKAAEKLAAEVQGSRGLVITDLHRMRTAVEAARTMALAFCTREEYPAHERLEAALRALDAGEAPVSPIQRDFGLEGDGSDYDVAKRLEHAATSRQQEIERLRSALARAEEENKSLRHDVAELGDELAGSASLLAEKEALRSELRIEKARADTANKQARDLAQRIGAISADTVALVERTAKAQRDKDIAYLRQRGREGAAESLVERPLVTLATLPGEKTSANIMDAPGGPRCACGKPSVSEDGSCADCIAQWADQLAGDLVAAGETERDARVEPAEPAAEGKCARDGTLPHSTKDCATMHWKTAESKPEAIDEHDEETCVRCHATMMTRDGDDPTPECDHCAHELLAELRALIASDAEVIAGLRAEVEQLRNRYEPGEGPLDAPCANCGDELGNHRARPGRSECRDSTGRTFMLAERMTPQKGHTE